MKIDWAVVSAHLTCPECGEKAYITPESDGYEAACRPHHFRLTREQAEDLTRQFGKPTYEDLEKRIAALEAQLTKEGWSSVIEHLRREDL